MKNLFLKNKVFIIAFVVIILIGIFQVVRFYKNDGNTVLEFIENEKMASNTTPLTQEEKVVCMQKGDTFLKLGDIIIYANDYDECIYTFNIKEKTYKNLYHSENGINRLYFDGEYVYLLPSYYRGKGIIRIDLLGNVNKIYEGGCIQFWIEDDKIFFTDQIGYDQINGTPQGNLCTINKDGTDRQIIIENVKNYFYLVNDNIYYTDKNSRSIYKANIDGTDKKEIAKGRTYITCANDSYLTYIDYNDGEKHRIIYLEDNLNKPVGRFGNVFNCEKGTYFYTRKLLDSNNNIEDNYTLYKVDAQNKTEEEYWTSNENGLEHLAYIYNDSCYFRRGSDFYKVNIKNKAEEEKMAFGSCTYFFDGKAFGIKKTDGKIEELYIYNLENMTKEVIKVK